jgi:LuxR family maltose regulon positive regulatory protein
MVGPLYDDDLWPRRFWPPNSLFPRPRLGERLNEGRYRKLTLVCAPVGFGKTTLLDEWVAAQP